jgi:hypothetical protein
LTLAEPAKQRAFENMCKLQIVEMTLASMDQETRAQAV